jgi:hypothetical protein
VGRPALLFLTKGPVGTLEVTARAQGQFPVVLDENSALRVRKSSGVGALFAPKTRGGALAHEVLHGRLLDDAARDVASNWARTHAR